MAEVDVHNRLLGDTTCGSLLYQLQLGFSLLKTMLIFLLTVILPVAKLLLLMKDVALMCLRWRFSYQVHKLYTIDIVVLSWNFFCFPWPSMTSVACEFLYRSITRTKSEKKMSEQIKVHVEDSNVLVVTVEGRREKEEGVKYVRMERRVGKLLKKFVLPETANVDLIRAVNHDGIYVTQSLSSRNTPSANNLRSLHLKSTITIIYNDLVPKIKNYSNNMLTICI